jgi:Ala-tRNA(Pro) deacylase
MEDRIVAIAPRLRHFLDRQHAVYELIDHPPTLSSVQSAAVAHIPPRCMAKAVLLDMPHDYLLAVLPSDRRIELADLWDELGDKPRLADEGEISIIFDDCAPGAVPPLGLGYGVATIIDEHLASEPDIFFEGGDHCSLVHMEQAEFRRLTERARRGRFGTLSSLIA